MIDNNMERHVVLKSKVWSSLSKIKRDKAAEQVEIGIEMLSVLDDLGINKFTEIINEIPRLVVAQHTDWWWSYLLKHVGEKLQNWMLSQKFYSSARTISFVNAGNDKF